MSCNKIKISDVCEEYDHPNKRCAHITPVWQMPGKDCYEERPAA